MKDAYEMLNDVQIDLKEYDESPLNDIEKKKIKNTLKKKIKPKKSLGKKVAMAAGVLLLVSIVGYNSNPSFASNIPLVGGIIKEITGYGNSDFDKYTNVIDQSVELNGFKVTLKEVVLDDNELRIATTFDSKDKDIKHKFLTLHPKVYINGKWLNVGGGGRKHTEDDGSYLTIDNLDIMKEDIPKNISMKVVYEGVKVIDPDTGKEIENVKGPWEFKFNVSKEKITAETRSYKIGKNLSTPGGGKMELEKLTSSPLTTGISFKLRDKDEFYNFIIRDDKGRELIAEGLGYRTHSMFMRNSYSGNMKYSAIPRDSKTLTFIPYFTHSTDKREIEKNGLLEVKDKFPMTITQNEKNKIIISKIETKDDEVYVEYITEGLSLELQKYNLNIYDENKNLLERDFSKGNVDKVMDKGEKITAVFKNKGSKRFFIGTDKMNNIEIHEDKSFEVKLD